MLNYDFEKNIKGILLTQTSCFIGVKGDSFFINIMLKAEDIFYNTCKKR